MRHKIHLGMNVPPSLQATNPNPIEKSTNFVCMKTPLKHEIRQCNLFSRIHLILYE